MTEESLPFILEGVRLERRALPRVPELQFWLMSDTYPRESLCSDDYARLMQQPPYWAFCWGGGQALARWILDHPDQIKGRAVVDFGAGCGVAGIAAAKAGAASVLAVDIDPDALRACRYNAELNGVNLVISDTFQANSDTLLLAADICYEESGFEGVLSHLRRGGHGLVAESRKRDLAQSFSSLCRVNRFSVRTFPDLEEASEFDEVHIFSTFSD